MNKRISLSLFALTLMSLAALFLARSPSSQAAGDDSRLSAQTSEPSEGGLAALPNVVGIPSEKAALGFKLFNDPRLSKTDSISCSSCHNLSSYGADSRALSTGVNGQIGEANTPTVFNSRFNFRQFWNGRAKNLGDQLEGPIHNPKEMASNWKEVIAKLKSDSDYLSRFNRVYNKDPDQATVTDAIIAFELELTTPNSPFDRYLRGDQTALTKDQMAGFQLFQSYGCVACHQGANVGGNMFQTLGIMGDYFKDRGKRLASDDGRFLVTGNPADRHMFRVPSLRNVAMTPPYFHDGQVATLNDAVRLMARYQLGRELKPEEVGQLVSFLTSLTGERPAILTRGQNGAASAKIH